MNKDSEMNDDSSVMVDDTTLMENDTTLLNDISMLNESKDSPSASAAPGMIENSNESISLEELSHQLSKVKNIRNKISGINFLMSLENIITTTTENLPIEAVKKILESVAVIENTTKTKTTRPLPSLEAFEDDLTTEVAAKITAKEIRDFILEIFSETEVVIKSCGYSLKEIGSTKTINEYINTYSNLADSLKERFDSYDGQETSGLVKTIKRVYTDNNLGNNNFTSRQKDLVNSLKNISTITESLPSWTTIGTQLKLTANSLLMTLDENLTEDTPLEDIEDKFKAIVYMQKETILSLFDLALNKLNQIEAKDWSFPEGKIALFNTIETITQGYYVPATQGILGLDHITKIDDSAPTDTVNDFVKYLEDNISTIDEYNKVTASLETLTMDFSTTADFLLDTSEHLKKVIGAIVKHADSKVMTETNNLGFSNIGKNALIIYQLNAKTLVVMALFAYMLEISVKVVNKEVAVIDKILNSI